MFQEYAVDPKLFSTLEKFKYWAKDFGAENGRVISEYPSKEWIKMAYEAIAETDTVKRQSLSARISKMREKKLLAKFNRSDYDPPLGWLNNACKQHHRSSFQALIATDAPEGIPSILLADDIDQDTEPYKCQRDCLCSRNGPALASKLRSFLHSAYDLKIIEPYFQPEEPRFAEPLRYILETAKEGVRLRTVEIHVSAEHSSVRNPTYFAQNCVLHLPQLLPTECSMRVFKWGNTFNGRKPHDRFLLSQLGGVQLGIGIAAQQDDEVFLSLLTEETRRRLWATYSDAGSAFPLEDTPLKIS
jgi:hypothetical protein